MAQDSRRNGTFDIAHAMSRGFGAYGANAAAFIGTSAFLSAPAVLMMIWWQSRKQGMFQDNPEMVLSSQFWGPFTAIILFSTVIGAILQAALSGAAVAYLEDEEPRFTDHLFEALTMVLPIIAMSILSTIAIFFGCLLLIFPGLMLATAWALLYPAYVRERPGVFGAFARSAELTSGYRWQVFAILLIVGIALWILQYLLGQLVSVFTMNNPIVESIASIAVDALTSPVLPCILASTYVDLRDVKEGNPSDTLERIFD